MNHFTSSDLDKILQASRSYSVGLDNIFHRLEARALADHEKTSYPPYNLIQVNEDESQLEMALAGFTDQEVKVYTEKGNLVVEGKKTQSDDREYVHRGMAQRSFTRTWSISEDTEVSNVTFENGLLVVTLTRVVPEARKKRFFLGGE